MRFIILDYPYPQKMRGSYKFISNFLQMITTFSKDNIYIVSDNIDDKNKYCNVSFLSIGVEIHLLKDIKPKILSIYYWILEAARVQIIMTKYLIKYRHNYDYVVFFLMHPINELFPLFITKVLRKKGVMVPLSPSPKGFVRVPRIYSIFEYFIFRYMDYLIPEYDSTTDYLNKNQLDIVRHKLLPPASFFILDEGYAKTTSINNRYYDVGYIGGFRKIKGILNFVEALPLINKEEKDIKFVIIGDGDLKDEVYEQIKTFKSIDVKLIDWIPHHLLPEYLNQIKILIIPSFSESGPFIAIEAMSCGAITVSTKVGVIPEIIVDKVNGYTLSDNSPSCISSKILNVIQNDTERLEQISDAAVKYVNDRYSQKNLVNNWSTTFYALERE